MKKSLKRIVACLLAVIMASCFLPMASFAAADQNGTCGRTANWNYASATKTLTISGRGEMVDYMTPSMVPWSSIAGEIENVKVTGVTDIGDYSFYGCTALKNVEISNSVTDLGDMAFALCTSLTSINIPVSVDEIETYAFAGCTSLNSIALPARLEEIGIGAFKGCISLKSVSIPNTLEDVDSQAFEYCLSLKEVSLPSNVDEIGWLAFSSCLSLESVRIYSRLARIDFGAIGTTNLKLTGSLDTLIGIYKQLATLTAQGKANTPEAAALKTQADAQAQTVVDTPLTTVVIHGTKNSVAQNYAQQNGLKFELLDDDPSTYCTCICHKSGFMGFIYKIERIFWKLFRINKYCDCGAEHY